MTESVLSGAPGGVEAVLEDDLSYRSSAPTSGTDTPNKILDRKPDPLTERLCA
jgi:hypothetical protein